MLIAILYCIGDIEAALTTPTGYPFIEIFTYATGSTRGGTAVSALIIVMFMACGISTLASASRQLWAFSRDKAVPNAHMMTYLHPGLKVPIVSIGVTTLVSVLLSLINIGSTTVFNAVVSLSVSGFFGSYIIPFSLLLVKRIKSPEQLPRAPYSLGKWGVPINAFAIGWSVLVLFFSFWPQNIPVTPVNMNWSVLLWGAVNIFAILFWVVHGRKVYKGPIVETHVEDARIMEGA
jgi:choline transport protein